MSFLCGKNGTNLGYIIPQETTTLSASFKTDLKRKTQNKARKQLLSFSGYLAGSGLGSKLAPGSCYYDHFKSVAKELANVTIIANTQTSNAHSTYRLRLRHSRLDTAWVNLTDQTFICPTPSECRFEKNNDPLSQD